MKLNQAIEIERQIFDKSVRESKEKLGSLLSERFIEIDYDGNFKDRSFVLNAVNGEDLRGHSISVRDYRLICGDHNSFSLQYFSALVSPKNEEIRVAKRLSTWINDAGSWKLVLHQAVPVNRADGQ